MAKRRHHGEAVPPFSLDERRVDRPCLARSVGAAISSAGCFRPSPPRSVEGSAPTLPSCGWTPHRSIGALDIPAGANARQRMKLRARGVLFRGVDAMNDGAHPGVFCHQPGLAFFRQVVRDDLVGVPRAACGRCFSLHLPPSGVSRSPLDGRGPLFLARSLYPDCLRRPDHERRSPGMRRRALAFRTLPPGPGRAFDRRPGLLFSETFCRVLTLEGRYE